MNKKNQKKSKKLCPFIKKPFDDCYCTKVMSIDADAAIRYCHDDYKKCRIYRKHVKDMPSVKKNLSS